MKLIIEITENSYKYLKSKRNKSAAENVIANGLIYKGHPIGEWVYLFTFLDSKIYECNHCNGRLSLDIPQRIEDFKFCNGCGAKMRGGETNEDI